MSSRNPHLTAIQHVSGILKGDSELSSAVGGRIYEGTVSKAQPAKRQQYPIVLIQPFGEAQDIQGLASRPASNVSLQILVIDEAKNMNALASIADRVDELLDGSGPADTGNGGHVAGCRRTQAIYRTEDEEGRVYRYLGGRYRLLTN